MGQMYNETRNQMNNWMWDNPHAFRDQINRSSLQTASLGMDKRTGKHFYWYGSNDLGGKMESKSGQRYKPGDLLPVRSLNWDELIDKVDDNENWVDPRAPSSGRSHLRYGNDTDDSKGKHDTQGSEKGTGKRQVAKDGKGKQKATEDGKGKGKALEKGNGKG